MRNHFWPIAAVCLALCLGVLIIENYIFYSKLTDSLNNIVKMDSKAQEQKVHLQTATAPKEKAFSDPLTGYYKLAEDGAAGGLYFVGYDKLASVNVNVADTITYHTCSALMSCDKDNTDPNRYICDGDDGAQLILNFKKNIIDLIAHNASYYCGVRMGMDGKYVRISN